MRKANPTVQIQDMPEAEVYIPQICRDGGGRQKTCTFGGRWGRKLVHEDIFSHFHFKVGKFYICEEIIAQKCNKK